VETFRKDKLDSKYSIIITLIAAKLFYWQEKYLLPSAAMNLQIGTLQARALE
jgi:hypothetical protein